MIRRYYDAINAHDFGTAYQQWRGDGEATGKSFDAFRNGFRGTRRSVVAIGPPGPSEGAAGSLYITIPVTIAALRDDGREERFAGTYVVRRVNDVDGASAQSRRWHIDSAKIRKLR
ncbi:MAG TPA: hypothetical protein VE567_02020 [Sphingomonas sp.]|nr:hypothetical protein [Sphingomonas sp.]